MSPQYSVHQISEANPNPEVISNVVPFNSKKAPSLAGISVNKNEDSLTIRKKKSEDLPAKESSKGSTQIAFNKLFRNRPANQGNLFSYSKKDSIFATPSFNNDRKKPINEAIA